MNNLDNGDKILIILFLIILIMIAIILGIITKNFRSIYDLLYWVKRVSICTNIINMHI